MLRRVFAYAAPVAVLSIWGMSSAAHADTMPVTFNTTNSTFAPATGAVLDNANVTTMNGVNSSSITLASTVNAGVSTTLTYNAQASQTIDANNPGQNTQFSLGNFVLSQVNGTTSFVQSLNGITFTLQINETAPGSGGNTVSSTVTGTVHETGSGGISDSVTISFSGGSAGLPNNVSPVFRFVLDNGQGGTSFNLNNTTTDPSAATIVTGDVSVVPLPRTASAGLGLFGVLGCVQGLSALRRRRHLA